MLPSVIPPSYKGSNIRYLYYVRSAITGGWLILENGQSRTEPTKDVTDLVGFVMTYYNCTGMYFASCYFHAELYEKHHLLLPQLRLLLCRVGSYVNDIVI